MSRLDNVEALEKQLDDLQMVLEEKTLGKIRKIPPAVPPKKKVQPQVPHSALVSTRCQPSYSTKITPVFSNYPPPVYNNASNNNIRNNQNYANFNHASPLTSTHKEDALSTQLPIKNFSSKYSKMPQHRNLNDNLPPPPPPPPPPPTLYTATKSYSNLHNEEFIPPPSPVSSNYSELAQATANLNFIHQDRVNYPPIYQNEYNDYGASQAPTYESLYEPINPRPASNLSGHVNNTLMSYCNNQSSPSKSPLPKEQEVDALTNLLVQSISDSQDLDVFGICVKCEDKVIGESSGCTAMGNMYHIKCFCCHHCKINLQGKAFYAVEGEPYCENDYFETLEKCSVCSKPILDRILRATGKPYHPTCFTCVACGISLDGIPFTVDAMNQIHCIEDFHKKFAPRCCVCNLPIMPEEGEEETVRVVALDRSFHVKCYRCEDCGILLSSEAEGRGCYPLDDHILCKTCNGYRIRRLTNVMTTDL